MSDAIDDERTLPLIPIENVPATPARAEYPAEGIYLRKWQAFAQRAPDEFAAIFRHAFREWTQPMATAAASFIMWLGTNCGNGFIQTARLRKEGGERAFFLQWCEENRRRVHVNSGVRTIEYLTSPVHPIVRTGLAYHVDWRLVHEVTMAEADAIECAASWLGSSQGGAFIAACEAEIVAHRKSERLFGGEHG